MILVYSYYVMDILHEGHLLQMRNAKALAGPEGRSIVGILTDEAVMEKKPAPALSFVERMRIARELSCVDLVVPQETYSPLPNVINLAVDILMESSSHSAEMLQEARQVMQELGGRLVVTPYYPGQSSTHIKQSILERSADGR